MSLRRQRGQATVEFALVVPLVLVALLAVAQVAVVGYAQLEVTHSAREAVRSIAVDPAVDLVELETRLGGTHELTVQALSAQPSIVQVVVTQPVPIVSPLFRPFLEHLELRATAEMSAGY